MMPFAIYCLILSAVYLLLGLFAHNVAADLTILFIAAIIVPGMASERVRWKGRHREPEPEPEYVQTDPDDRRQDLDSRGRVARLEARYHRVVRLLFVAILALTLANVAAFGGIKTLFDRVHTSRVRSAAVSCSLRNDQNKAIVTFVEGVAPDLKARIEGAFPVIPDCAAYARRQVR